MSRLPRRLRYRVVATHLVVALSGAVTFVVAAAILVLVLPPPPSSDAALWALGVATVSAAAGLAVSGLAAAVASSWLFDTIAVPVRRMTKMARRMQCSIYVKNAPTLFGLGLGEGYATMSIGTPTGDGLTKANHFARPLQCSLVGYFRIA